jgi:hypothetical protein
VTSDPAALLSCVADALNALERAGIICDVDHDAVSTRFGFVIPVGDPRLGHRWAVRTKTEQPPQRHPDTEK